MRRIFNQNVQICLQFVFLILLQTISISYCDETNPFQQTEVVDRQGKYILSWLVSWEEDRIYFNVTAETLGYVGFGLSKKGKMAGADIVIGGVGPNGKPYFGDYYAIGHQHPILDQSQDWTLHAAWESATHTFLSFSRRLETCDHEHDLPINEDVLALLWCYGERDRIEYHYQNRGTYDRYVIDPTLTPRSINELHYKNVTSPPQVNQLGDWKVWRLSFTEKEMPTQDTAYYCTIHKAPSHPRKQHIVGFRTLLNSAVERRHIHHLILHRCYAPEGTDPDEIFGPHVGGEAEECYVHLLPTTTLPGHFCLEISHEWAVGGEPVFFPDHVGMPFTESENEYYMFQVHFNNPEGISNIKLSYGLEMFHTENLRQYDAGLMFVGTIIGVPLSGAPTIMIPPSELGHTIYGHCSSQCTQKILPETGINVFATRSHTHLAGRGVRILHIQNGREESISVDDNFNFDYQEYRILRREKKIMPGDIFGHFCKFGTEDRDGNVTVRGFQTLDEMCHGFMWYYPYSRDAGTFGTCASDIRATVYKDFLQINTTVWDNNRRIDIVTSPATYAGLSTQEAGNLMDWSIARRTQLQAMHRNLNQMTFCSSSDPDNVARLIREELERRNGTNVGTIINTPDGTITHPDSEFISRWPANVAPYQKASRCRL